MLRQRAIWSAVAAAVLLVLTAAYLLGPTAGKHPQGGEPPLAGEMRKFSLAQPSAPAAAISFTDDTGKPYGLADMAGKVVLVNFWATWCAPCVAEMPSLDRLQAELGGSNFEVVTLLSLDKGGAAAATSFFQKQEIRRLRPYLDPNGVAARALQVTGLPTSILIDRSGREIGRMMGAAKWDEQDAKALIRHYIDQPLS